jgi:hypothetical protein
VAWDEYNRDHVPEETRRQVFKENPKVTDQTATSYDEMRALHDAVYATWGNMRQASDEVRVHLRSTLMKTIDKMKRRNGIMSTS